MTWDFSLRITILRANLYRYKVIIVNNLFFAQPPFNKNDNFEDPLTRHKLSELKDGSEHQTVGCYIWINNEIVSSDCVGEAFIF